MPGYRKKQPVRNLGRLFRMLGIQFPEDMPKVENKDNIEINSHTQSELRYMPGMSILEQNADKNIDSAGLSSYLNKVAQSNNEWIEQADAIAQAKADEKVQEMLDGKQIIKEIYVPGKIINIVAK